MALAPLVPSSLVGGAIASRSFPGRWLAVGAPFCVCSLLYSSCCSLAERMGIGDYQTLTRGSAIIAVEALNIAGLVAVRRGNLIEVATGVVGIEEACSGVRGLQSSLMISLVLGELGRLSILRRVVLVLVGAVMALLLNLLRAIGLSVLASTRGGLPLSMSGTTRRDSQSTVVFSSACFSLTAC
jgi:exosortase/archaeosortase family protein